MSRSTLDHPELHREGDAATSVDSDRPPRRGMDSYGVKTVLLAIAVAIAAAGLGAAVAAAQEDRYAAELEILHQYGNMDAAASERRQATQATLAEGRAVLAPVADQFDVGVDEVSEQLSAELVGASEVLRLRVTDPDPERALAMVSAVGDSYLEVTQETRFEESETEEIEVITERIEGLEQRRADLQQELDDLELERRADSAEAGAAVTPSGREQRLQIELQEVLRRLGDLESVRLRQELEAAESRPEPARLLTEAYVLDDPVGPTPLRAGALGFGIGLVLAVAIVAMRSLLRPSSPRPRRSGRR
jgi:capsular polysaccharide biosynthesis protein